VSNVRKALLAREWVELGKDGVVLVQPDVLLQTWRESYRRPSGETIDAGDRDWSSGNWIAWG